MCEQQTILLTGATGFLGSHLLEALLEKGHKVIVLKRSTSNTWRIEKLLPNIVSYDVDTQPLELAFEEQGIDSVIHTACNYGRNNNSMSEVVDSNVLFGLKILDACIKYGVRTFINTDTFFNTGISQQKYLSTYILSKKQFLEWIKEQSSRIQIINLKLEHIYGPKDDNTKFIPWILSQLKQKSPDISLTEGTQERDFIYITDVVSAYTTVLINASNLPKFSEFDVGTGKLFTIKFVVEQLKLLYENKYGEVPTKLKFGSIPYRNGELMTVDVDNKTLLTLGWKPNVNIQNGLEKIISNVTDFKNS